ncbi:hypothetical protein ACWDHH_01780 [Janibacter hoylei]|uniref:hypothetical protein n=1 Tax=Janibacter hoylei TaxID=364298 RepID=UPI0036B9E8C9
MCATNLWAINAAAFTSKFQRFTEGRLGMPPVQTTMRIASGRVRGSSVVFTLTSRMCDCDTLIGRRNEAPVHGEIEADAWLGWLRDMPDHVANVSRVAVLRAWSPGDDDVVPSRARGIGIGELSESVLRDVRDDTLLTIDYPRVV